MRNVNETVYVRIPFVVEDPSVIRALTLRMRFDDGMIAYINGHEVARDNAPALTAETWNSGALRQLARSTGWCRRRISASAGSTSLHVGTNVLAVQGLNNGPGQFGPAGHSGIAGDHRVEPYRCSAISRTPTPGGPNNAGVEALGPIIADVNHAPAMPTARSSLTSHRPSLAAASTPWLRSSCAIG